MTATLFSIDPRCLSLVVREKGESRYATVQDIPALVAYIRALEEAGKFAEDEP